MMIEVLFLPKYPFVKLFYVQNNLKKLKLAREWMLSIKLKEEKSKLSRLEVSLEESRVLSDAQAIKLREQDRVIGLLSKKIDFLQRRLGERPNDIEIVDISSTAS